MFLGFVAHPGSDSLHMHGAMYYSYCVQPIWGAQHAGRSRSLYLTMYEVLHRPAVTKGACDKRVTCLHCICALKTQTSTEGKGMAPFRPGLVVVAPRKLRKHGEALVGETCLSSL